MRLPDGRHFDPWVRVHERIGGVIIGVCERSMYWRGQREQGEEGTKVRLPQNGALLIDGSTGWLKLTTAMASLRKVASGCYTTRLVGDGVPGGDRP